jgi:hypothetical protein
MFADIKRLSYKAQAAGNTARVISRLLMQLKRIIEGISH